MIQHSKIKQTGFALPTILIASVVMIIVMLAAIQSVVSIRAAFDNQYYSKIGQEAAESGAIKAKMCIEKNGSVTWSDASPLRPNTDCNGGVACTNAASCYVLNNSSVRLVNTTFSVPAPSTNSNGELIIITNSATNLLRSSNSLAWKTYTNTLNQKINITALNWKQLSSGYAQSCAIAYDNNTYCWGGNTYGQLGNNTTTNSSVPVAVTTSGVLSGKTIKSISAGYAHVCVIASDNNAYCWGYNTYGTLGNNTTTNSSVPVAVTTSGVLSGKTISSISSGNSHVCVIASDNNAYCWGYNTYGQLGNNTTTNSSVPVAVTTSGVLSGKTIKSVSAGYGHSCVIASDNNAYCWGYNTSGQLGNNTTTNSSVPVAVTTSGVLSGKTISSISTSFTHSCAIASDGNAYCWGANTSGRLGNNTTTNSSVPVAVTTSGVLSGKTIKSISTGSSHVCVIASDNNTYCWGGNTYGQLGNNTTTNSSVPVAVTTSGVLSGKAIKSISTGESHVCVITSDNNTYCWGANTSGQLGNNTTTNSSVPVAINPPPGVPTVQVFYY